MTLPLSKQESIASVPIYEYRAIASNSSCYHCQAGFEMLQAATDEALNACPACGKPIERIISAPAIGASQSNFDDKAKSSGFTKLRKISKGEYEKEY